MSPLLEVHDLTVEFATHRGTLKAVDKLSFEVGHGESVAIIGESGSGKTTTGLAVLGLVRPPGKITGGHIIFQNQDITAMPESRLREMRGDRISMVFQNPMTALDPTFTVGEQIVGVMRSHRRWPGRSAARRRAIELMESVHIPSARQRFDAYPHQLSGGTKQRILIGMALANEPDLIIADEPTTALDVTVQAQVLALFQEIQAHMGLSVLFITHNLGVAAQIAQRIIVLYAGRAAEIGPAAMLTQHPHHPYANGLLRSIPIPGAQQVRLEPIPGQPPDLTRLPQGCAFAPRCAFAMDICRRESPPLKVVDGADHLSACVLP